MSSSTLQNIVIGVIGLVLIALGYFLFIKPSSFSLGGEAMSPLDDQVQARTQEFIARRDQLNQVTLDQSVFSDSRFTSLRSYTPPVTDQTLGKSSVFDGADTMKGVPASGKSTH
jgi:hypothetical protein